MHLQLDGSIVAVNCVQQGGVGGLLVGGWGKDEVERRGDKDGFIIDVSQTCQCSYCHTAASSVSRLH